MGKISLPFGRTRVSEKEIRNVVSIEPTVDALTAKGRSEAEARSQVETFVTTIPKLLEWLAANGRHFPWRETRDPWGVYSAEILLQRTRANAVANLYEDFHCIYPSPSELAAATEAEIYELVRPLGFGNQRTRTLQDVATMLTDDYSGEVPQDLESLQEPWRVGPYSARATLLFAFNVPLSLVDQNFARVFHRVFDYPMPSQPHKDDQVLRLISGVTPKEAGLARAFNLAILDLGALICQPSSPHCTRCPLERICAYAAER